jgi:catechol 2,3-dioxygenase-like lactoylglutathione lyase family enzyme
VQLQFLDYTVLIVAELDRSLDFYVNLLGLPLNHRSGGYAQLRTGSTRLSLFTREALERTLRKPLQAPSDDAPGFELAFLVENVDEAFDELVAKGARAEQAPMDRFWGQRTAYLRDPDGYLVELTQNLG